MSVQRPEIQAHLSRILIEEARLLAELEVLLGEETETLRGDDVEAIARIGSTRHRCIDSLIRLDAERADAARMLSYGSGRGAVEKLYAWSDPSGALEATWRSNLEIARRCKDLNDCNGAIVAAKLGRVQQLLAQLRGVNAAPIYTAKGSRYAGLGARDLGHA